MPTVHVLPREPIEKKKKETVDRSVALEQERLSNVLCGQLKHWSFPLA